MKDENSDVMNTLTPLKNLGANLMLVFAIGGLWSVGYLVTPMLIQHELIDQSNQLRLIVMLLAFVSFVIVLLSTIKNKGIKVKSVPQQMNMISLLLIIFYLIANKFNPELLPLIYGLTSLAGVAWVAYLKIE
jgi:hypothetical protein